MGFLDQALDNYRPPAPDELEITLPQRREQQKGQPGESSGAAGQHGGAADGAPTAAETHGDAAGGGSADPAPQRDEPDEGEHTDSTQEQVARRAPAGSEGQGAEDPAPGEHEEPLEEPVDAIADEEIEEPVDVKAAIARTVGTDPRTFKRKSGFSAGENAPSITVTRFPEQLVDRLRLTLAAHLGGDFAEVISAPALLTAFLVAKLGVRLDLDENTSVAADAFRASDPGTVLLQERLDEVDDSINQLAGAMKLSLERISDSARITDGLELAMAYLITDRVAGLSSPEINETNVDVAQKKVLTARERIRETVKEQRSIERRQNSGWRMA